jgi:hypothetical protein
LPGSKEEHVLVPSRAKHAKPEQLPEIDPIDHWDVAMANATAHLRSAFHLIAALDTPSAAAPGSFSFELAFRNLCTTLIALDDCCNTVWTSPRTGIVILERNESFD